MCPALDRDEIGNRGEYSFVAGGAKCHKCTPGRLCHGGSKMTTEWGWWVSSGLDEHKNIISDNIKEQSEAGLSHLNHEQCSPEDLPITNTTYSPLECGSKCVKDKDAGCLCKYSVYEGREECRIWCDTYDIYRGGLYMDQCGLPKKVTRCSGYQKLVTCEINYKKQFKELQDENHVRTAISIEGQCQSCRPNSISAIRDVEAKVTTESFAYKKLAKAIVPRSFVEGRSTSNTSDTVDVYVDVLWMFENLDGSKVDSDFSLHKNFNENSPRDVDVWPLTLVTYNMDGAGTWDQHPYSTFTVGGVSIDHMSKSKSDIIKNEKEFSDGITVALLRNDPRLQYIYAAVGISGGDFNATSPVYMDCNIMSGHTGRLCQTCVPGFKWSDSGCIRCSHHDLNVMSISLNVVLAFLFIMFTVYTVLSNAGNMPNATIVKRILLSHMQTIALLSNFDLDWAASSSEFFKTIGTISTIGDDLIQTGCITSLVKKEEHELPPFYTKSIIFTSLLLAFVFPGCVYHIIKHLLTSNRGSKKRLIRAKTTASVMPLPEKSDEPSNMTSVNPATSAENCRQRIGYKTCAHSLPKIIFTSKTFSLYLTKKTRVELVQLNLFG